MNGGCRHKFPFVIGGCCRGFFFADDCGFTTTGMVLALLISLSLIFTSAQVYRVNSAAAEVQDIADAAALAAQTQVAEYMLAVRVCDAVVLSYTLSALTVMGLGIAALCTPFTASASAALIKASRHLLQARDRFSSRATSVLNKLQKALPYYAAACAAGVARQNTGFLYGTDYIGAAVLVPSQGSLVGFEGDDADALLDTVEDQADDIRKKAEEAEEAAQEAARSKERAYMHDCGNNPDYCMYERAGKLAGMTGTANPFFASVDTWSFTVALQRAQAYYHERMLHEGPADVSLAEQARSALRKRFYLYADREVAQGYVHETGDSFEANFPHLPRNTQTMRYTTLYTDVVYPITVDDEGVSTMHAWAGCPRAAASLERGSIQQLESGSFDLCPVCEFRPSSMGKVAAASTSIQNGFEYHYKAVADEAAVYEEARRRADVPKAEVQDKVGSLLDKLREVMAQTAGKRISADPPGSAGCVAFAASTSSVNPAGRFGTSFVAGGGSLGTRVALSGATVLDEGTEEGANVISSLLDGLGEDTGVLAGAAGIVLDCWSWSLTAYANGQDAITGAIESGLNTLPLSGESGLGTWVSRALRDGLESVGLQPAKVSALKPVLVNSGLVAAADKGSFGKRLVSLKQTVNAHPLRSTDLFGSLITDAEQTALATVDSWADGIQIASLEVVEGGGTSIPLTLALPASVQSFASGTIASVFGRLRSLYASVSGVRTWE